jgi:hypothetical protein
VEENEKSQLRLVSELLCLLAPQMAKSLLFAAVYLALLGLVRWSGFGQMPDRTKNLFYILLIPASWHLGDYLLWIISLLHKFVNSNVDLPELPEEA